MSDRNNKPCIVLDLDETLIHSMSTQEYNETTKNQKKRIDNLDISDMDDYYTVIERPGLQEFLDILFKHFNVSVWTAASKDYASFIVENILLKKRGKGKPKRQLEWLFFSYHCKISKKEKKSIKDLSVLWDVYNIESFTDLNTIILDDNTEVYDTQPNNCIYMDQFSADLTKIDEDDFLKRLQPYMKDLIYSFESEKKISSVDINENMK